MANHKDAAKRALTSVKRRNGNRSHRTRMRNQIQGLRTGLQAATVDADTVTADFRKTVSIIQRLVTKGVIHRNQGARRVARLAAAVNAKIAK